MKINNFNRATLWITALNYITALRNFERFENRRRFLFVWLYDILILCTFIVTIFIFQQFYLVHLLHTIDRIMYTFLLLACSTSFTCILVLGWYHSKDLLALKKEIASFEERFKRLGSIMNYRMIFIRTLILGCIWFADWIALCLLYGKWFNKIKLMLLIVSIVFNYGSNIGAVPLFEFVIYVYCLGIRFKGTNDLLNMLFADDRQVYSKSSDDDKKMNESMGKFHRQLSRNFNKWFSPHSPHSGQVFPMNQTVNLKHKTESEKKRYLLQEIRFAHLQLCGITKMLNNIFNWQLLFHVSITILHFTVVLYYFYTNIYKSTFTKHAEEVIISLVESLYNCLKIFVACYVCECTLKEANKIVEIIHSYSLYDFDADMKDEILQFSLQISFNQLGCERDRFFRLNYSFLRECISFVTTYLVIMIQWSQSIEFGESFIDFNETNID